MSFIIIHERISPYQRPVLLGTYDSTAASTAEALREAHAALGLNDDERLVIWRAP